MNTEIINAYGSVQEAVDCWSTNPLWMREYWERNYSYSANAACVCYDVNNPDENYFIITHPECVRYRVRKNQVVFFLHHNPDSPGYISNEDVYPIAMDRLDLSNPEPDQEFKMAELMGMVYVDYLGKWFDYENYEQSNQS